MLLMFHNVTFGHDQATEPLFRDISPHFTPGWTGIVGANGTGKTTLLKLACGRLHPGRGSVQAAGRVVYCAQRTDHAPRLLGEFLTADDREACRLRGVLQIGEDWASRWRTLSHGERKRAQIAVALWQEPQVLAVDEPTNHIDAPARDLLQRALAGFSGIGLLVSHDRDLLDSLCSACLFTEPPRVTLRPGGYSEASAQAALERESAGRRREQAERELRRVEGLASDRRRAAGRADRKRSKRGLGKKDHDAKAKINLARLTGKDGQAGRLARQLQGRTRQLRRELEGMEINKTYEQGIWLPGSRSRRKALFSLPEGSLNLGAGRVLRYPALHMGPRDRIGITGPNGAGKSTLLESLAAGLDLPADRVVYLPQEIGARQSREILDRVRALNREDLGRVMTIVSRLGSRPARLLETTQPSPGEMRKILLALGIIKSPHLVIMDEPTNHLDLPAIECLEAALADCPCGLLLVSHDLAFLRNLTSIRWHIEDRRLTVGGSWE